MIYTAIEIALIALTAASIAVCAWKSKNLRVSAALLVVLISALAASDCGDFMLLGLALFVGSGLCVVSLNPSDRWMLNIEKSEVNYAIAFIMMLRMPFVILYSVGWCSLSVLWSSAAIFLLLENLIILEVYANGNAKRVNDRITNLRVRIDELIFSCSRV